MTGVTQCVLLYDEDCSFCRWSLDKILAWDRGKRLRPVPIQSAEGSHLLAPVPADARLDSWHLVLADGRVLSAGVAAQHLARLLPGGRPLAAVFGTFPGVIERCYQLVVCHRDDLARLLRIDSNSQVRPHA